jgi:3-phosphoshikimate 1-carboxyvinyltransferase
VDIRITPKKLAGSIIAVSSKSDVHRLLIAAALSKTATYIHTNIIAKDIEATIGCLRTLGAGIEIFEHNNEYKIFVMPIRGDRSKSDLVLDCGESGSTARMLLPVTAGLYSEAKFIGRGSLPPRPFTDLIDEMEKNGCKFDQKNIPFTVSGRLKPGKFTLSGSVTSQFISGLLFALPLLEGDSKIILTTKLQSSGYVDMTIATLRRFGITIGVTADGFEILGNQKYNSPGEVIAEGDWSNSAFFIAAGIKVNGLNENSFQKDKRIISLLDELNESDSDELVFDAEEIPDLVPILAVAACSTNKTTMILNAARLRIKESDRLNSVYTMLKSLGADIEEGEDNLTIHGNGALAGGTTDSFNDHRIPMAAAIASCICKDEVFITNAEAVGKSYPRFFDDFNSLGGKADVI